jgi:AmiR/NasT family two-component response regulator
MSSNRRSKVVAQASGMVSVQADCSLDAALVRMEERAASTDETLDEIAHAVVERQLRFTPGSA